MANTSSGTTIVIELGSSRIKVGFAGEPRPRRVLDDSSAGVGCGHWEAFFQRLTPPTFGTTDGDGPASAVVTTTYEWEKIINPLFSHILTSILFIQRAPRYRMLLLINDIFPARHFREALHRVILEYLGVGGVWLVNGGVFESMYYIINGMPSLMPSSGRPKAQMLVDIGTYEARVVVSVEGSSVLVDTIQTTMSGYQSFLCQVLENYNEKVDETRAESDTPTPVRTLDDANTIVQSWVTLPSTSSLSIDSPIISIKLPSNQHLSQSKISAQTPVELPLQPLLRAFHQMYLDYTNPNSLIFNILTCAMACPIDFRRGVLQNILLLGGGSVALRHFGCLSKEGLLRGLGLQLKMAARDACRSVKEKTNAKDKGEEKKEDDSLPISSMSRLRFQSLRHAVVGHVNHEGKNIDGINIQYLDHFAADMVAWIGGSIMGTLGGHYQKKM